MKLRGMELPNITRNYLNLLTKLLAGVDGNHSRSNHRFFRFKLLKFIKLKDNKILLFSLP